MLSKSQARAFFLVGTGASVLAFIGLTIDTISRVPAQTHAENITPAVERGKDLWDRNNCMGCHTLFGEGAYYAPELTKVMERRGDIFVRSMLKDPEAMYPGQRKMKNYNFKDDEITDLIAFLKWCGEVDLNGFPPKADLVPVAIASGAVTETTNRPQIFNQVCVACHAMDGQGGAVGPALDAVGDRYTQADLRRWLADPQAYKPGTTMPKLPLSTEEIAELAAFLGQKKVQK